MNFDVDLSDGQHQHAYLEALHDGVVARLDGLANSVDVAMEGVREELDGIHDQLLLQSDAARATDRDVRQLLERLAALEAMVKEGAPVDEPTPAPEPPTTSVVRTVYPAGTVHPPRPAANYSDATYPKGTVITGGQVYKNNIPRTMYADIRADSMAARHEADSDFITSRTEQRTLMWLGCHPGKSLATNVGKSYSTHLAGLFMAAAELGVTAGTFLWKEAVRHEVDVVRFKPAHNKHAGMLLLFAGLEALDPFAADKEWLRARIHTHLNAAFGKRPMALDHPSERYGNYLALHLNAACQLASVAEARLGGALGQRATDACTHWCHMLGQLRAWADTPQDEPFTFTLPDGTLLIEPATGYGRSRDLVDNTINWARYLGWTDLNAPTDPPSPYWSMGTAPKRP